MDKHEDVFNFGKIVGDSITTATSTTDSTEIYTISVSPNLANSTTLKTGQWIESHLGTSCLICGETVSICDIGDTPKICDKCKAAVLKIRERHEIEKETKMHKEQSTALPTKEEFEAKYQNYGTSYDAYTRYSTPKYTCSKCGGGMCKNEMIILTSCPAQYEYKCDKCGHIEYQRY